MDSELDRAIAALHFKARSFEVQLSEFGPQRLKNADAFLFFRRLVNYEPATITAAHLTRDTHLDYFVADSAVECHRDHLTVGRENVKVLSMKEPPSQTFAHLPPHRDESPQAVAVAEGSSPAMAVQG